MTVSSTADSVSNCITTATATACADVACIIGIAFAATDGARLKRSGSSAKRLRGVTGCGAAGHGSVVRSHRN